MTLFIGHFEWLVAVTSSACAKFVNKLILSLIEHPTTVTMTGDTESTGQYISMCRNIQGAHV